MATRLPIIASDSVWSKNCVSKNENGYIFHSGNAEELSAHAIQLFYDEEKRRVFCSCSKSIAKRFDWESACQRIVNEITRKIHKASIL